MFILGGRLTGYDMYCPTAWTAFFQCVSSEGGFHIPRVPKH